MSITGIIPGIAGLTATWLVGYNVVSMVMRGRLYFRISAGWLLGSGITSLSMLLIYFCRLDLRVWLPAVQCMLVVVSLIVRRYVGKRAVLAERVVEEQRPLVTGWLLLALLAVVGASVGIHAVTMPAVSFDELHNWGFKALSTSVSGRPFEGYWPFKLFPNNVPFLGASVHIWLLEPRETLTHLVPFFFFLSALGCLCHGAVELSGRRHWGLPVVVLFVLGSPILMKESDRLTCDVALTSLTVAATVFAMIWLKSGTRATLIFCGIFSGLCAWTKTEGLMLAAGIGGAVGLGSLIKSKKFRGSFCDTLVWLAAVLVVIGPWYAFLKIQGIGMESSGHLGSLQFERLSPILGQIKDMLRVHYMLPSIAFILFVLGSIVKGNRPQQVALLIIVAAGFGHAILPLLLLPEGAFTGWRNFMRVGMHRYLLHFAPVMMLSVAAASNSRLLSSLDGVFQLLVHGRIRRGNQHAGEAVSVHAP